MMAEEAQTAEATEALETNTAAPAVQAEGLKLLKSIFCLNVKYHETILEEVCTSPFPLPCACKTN